MFSPNFYLILSPLGEQIPAPFSIIASLVWFLCLGSLPLYEDLG